MKWEKVRQEYPNRWLLIEAATAHTENDTRIVEEIVVISSFDDAKLALQAYLATHKQNPTQELYVAHTSRETLDIKERKWAGVRTAA